MNDVVHRVIDNPFTNAAVVGRKFGVHRDPVRKVWNDVGLHHRIAANKPFLTTAQCEERLGYALENINRDWNNVIFSDEKTFQTDRHQRTHLYRPNNTRYDERYIQLTRRSGRVSCGLWGWISRGGPDEMTMIPGRLNSAGYIEVLRDVLIPSVEAHGNITDIVFMQVSLP